ncbi:HlyD family efflux transporter periplasmic adaptor subunit [Massilia sp. Root418]|jgi:multidrug resistance efflux pump|uniref:HlyD family efflux transporter periplasmic adaptor subunit n=1 Tax=Massilia sp. Root418 TaxID=1736532 RepID=UPI0009E9E093|nr:HlyD family efflux transporter periplasmic adaptor subunit [Massilia sp. Root418]
MPRTLQGPASQSLAGITLCALAALSSPLLPLLSLLPLQAAHAASATATATASAAAAQETNETRISDAYAEALRQCTLRASVAGEITELTVKAGDRVKAGQVLARIGGSEISAPYDAIVSAVMAKVGDVAMPGRHVITVFDPSRMRVVASVPRSRLRELNLDEPVQVEIAALKQRVKAQKVIVISQGDKPMQMAKLYLELGEVAGLQPGQQARATFALSSWPSLRP